MADFLTKRGRSALMSKIRSRGNAATELAFIKVLKQLGISGWRRGYSLKGKPDFVFPKLRLAVFVDGCFWHGCPRCGRVPKSNRRFWLRKFTTNAARDRVVTRQLRRAGWNVVRIWQHEFKPKHAAKLIRRLSNYF